MNNPSLGSSLTSDPAAAEALAQQLVQWFQPAGNYAIALSGGVDSAVVAKAASLSNASVVAVTARSPSVAEQELSDADEVGKSIGIPHVVLDTSEVLDPLYRQNDARRCYHCKSQLFATMQREFPAAVIVTGTNADDLSDYRPGLDAAREAKVRAPLAELGFGKSSVRTLAANWGLHLAAKPASPCLASRIAHGVEVTEERLAMVERAEQVLRGQGLHEFRVRLHGDDLARIEVSPQALLQLVANGTRQTLTQELHQIGFRFVTLDLDGFRTGSLNPLVQLTSSVRPPA